MVIINVSITNTNYELTLYHTFGNFLRTQRFFFIVNEQKKINNHFFYKK